MTGVVLLVVPGPFHLGLSLPFLEKRFYNDASVRLADKASLVWNSKVSAFTMGIQSRGDSTSGNFRNNDHNMPDPSGWAQAIVACFATSDTSNLIHSTYAYTWREIPDCGYPSIYRFLTRQNTCALFASIWCHRATRKENVSNQG